MNNHPIIIETLSPLHIGKGDSLTSVGEYVATSNRIRIIDQVHLHNLLDEKGLQQEYMDYILNYAKNTHVWDFFTGHKIENEVKYNREFPLHAAAFNPDSNNILELAIETAGQKYIPGSSLKGAIRTLLFAYCIGADHSLRSRVENIIATADDLYTIKKRILHEEDTLLNSELNLFRVEDSLPVAEENVVAEISKRAHLFGVRTEGLDNLRECIDVGTLIKTTISVIPQLQDSNLLWLNRDDLSGFFHAVNTVTDHYIDVELKLLSKSTDSIAKEIAGELLGLQKQLKQSADQSAILRLGKGKTFIFQVILPMLNEASQNKIIRLLVNDADARINFPKTRVLTDNNKMFGWIKLSLPELPTSEINYFNNIIENPLKGVTKLKAYFLETKKVCLMYNGIFYPSLQLVNQLKTHFKKGQEIEVVLQQLSNEGKIIHVKLD